MHLAGDLIPRVFDSVLVDEPLHHGQPGNLQMPIVEGLVGRHDSDVMGQHVAGVGQRPEMRHIGLRVAERHEDPARLDRRVGFTLDPFRDEILRNQRAVRSDLPGPPDPIEEKVKMQIKVA
ncbi:hypothetical protein [Brevundimonas sp. EYE_349]|uniref:hypothetical protein n=1 Tax=Brevundimonas sp. EYE_349 TaxID=2853455 RepID=UPI0020033168|nr:hypothetical protein [Brevundimonas sp. EYE_349]MCK6102959.1 hypothetical protein [Brevundimonas sp. EYE_349]